MTYFNQPLFLLDKWYSVDSWLKVQTPNWTTLFLAMLRYFFSQVFLLFKYWLRQASVQLARCWALSGCNVRALGPPTDCLFRGEGAEGQAGGLKNRSTCFKGPRGLAQNQCPYNLHLKDKRVGIYHQVCTAQLSLFRRTVQIAWEGSFVDLFLHRSCLPSVFSILLLKLFYVHYRRKNLSRNRDLTG